MRLVERVGLNLGAVRMVGMVVILSWVMSSLGGCASGPKYTAMTMPAIGAGQGRIVVFRDGFPLGVAIQPEVRVDNRVVGKSVPNNFFFVDVPPGVHRVSCQTEWRHDTDVTVVENQVLYVQTHIAPGVVVGQVWPEVVDAGKAVPVLKKCTYNGVAIGAN